MAISITMRENTFVAGAVRLKGLTYSEADDIARFLIAHDRAFETANPRPPVELPSVYTYFSDAPISRTSDNATDATEVTLLTLRVPGGLLGPNALVDLHSVWSYPNSASTKSLIPRIGVSSLASLNATTTVVATLMNRFWNKNALNAQAGPNSNSPFGGTSGNALFNFAIDTSQDFDLTLGCKWGANVAAETITLERANLIIYR